mmetsp:Transcript_14898/g.44977  ORF Transcript_14898/g.44977 Transcript_14898/m.44977 type:complete len:358 (-) Transcript_14898:3089-4162(-)
MYLGAQIQISQQSSCAVSRIVCSTTVRAHCQPRSSASITAASTTHPRNHYPARRNARSGLPSAHNPSVRSGLCKGVAVRYSCSRRTMGDATGGAAPSLGHSTRAVAAAAGKPSDVFALDFDGVLIDSAPEVNMAGWRAALKYWPDAVSVDQRDSVLAGLAVTRPVIVDGWETMVMARILAEDSQAAQRILADWPAVMKQSLESWGTDLKDMRTVFETSRNEWMNGEEADWLTYAQPYPNIKETLQYCEHPFYIVSSKKAHRISRVAQRQLGLDVPEDSPRLFAGLIPPDEQKIETLKMIAERPMVVEGGATLHFIDDRFETVQTAAANADLRARGVKIYFASWGGTGGTQLRQSGKQ